MVTAHGQDSQKLRSSSNFDEVGLAAIRSMQRLYPQLLQDPDFMHVAASTPFGVVKTQSPVVRIEPYKTALRGWLNVTRPAEYDSPAEWVVT